MFPLFRCSLPLEPTPPRARCERRRMVSFSFFLIKTSYFNSVDGWLGWKLSILLSLKLFSASPLRLSVFASPGRIFQLFFFFHHEEKRNLGIFLIFGLRFLFFFFSFRRWLKEAFATRYIILNPFHAELIDVFPQSPSASLLRQCLAHTSLHRTERAVTRTFQISISY